MVITPKADVEVEVAGETRDDFLIYRIWPKDVGSAFDKDVWLGECDNDFFTDELCLGDVERLR